MGITGSLNKLRAFGKTGSRNNGIRLKLKLTYLLAIRICYLVISLFKSLLCKCKEVIQDILIDFSD